MSFLNAIQIRPKISGPKTDTTKEAKSRAAISTHHSHTHIPPKKKPYLLPCGTVGFGLFRSNKNTYLQKKLS
jgi:hypothetical protein